MPRLIISSILILLVAGCGGGGDDDDPTSTATSANGSATANGTSQSNGQGAPEVGEVENADGDAFVNDERADRNLELRAGDSISTGDDSSIDFILNAVPGVECKTRSNSDLVVRPDEDTQVQWTSRDGISFCTVERGNPPVQATFGIDPDVEIDVEGTLFGVVDDGTLKVVEGFVMWRSPGKEQRIGPNEQVSTSSSREAWQSLPADEDAVVNEFPAPPPPPPPNDGEFRQSPLLSAMQGQNAIVVLLDESAGSETEDFVWAYFTLLGETWLGSDDIDVQYVSRQEAEVLLQQTSNAVYVATAYTPTAAQQTPTRTATGTAVATATITQPLDVSRAPFYVDESGQAWSIIFPADQPAFTAFARFTRGILTTGAYFDLYSPIFGGNAPPYDELLAVVP